MSVRQTESLIWSLPYIFGSYTIRHPRTKPNGCQRTVSQTLTLIFYLISLLIQLTWRSHNRDMRMQQTWNESASALFQERGSSIAILLQTVRCLKKTEEKDVQVCHFWAFSLDCTHSWINGCVECDVFTSSWKAFRNSAIYGTRL